MRNPVLHTLFFLLACIAAACKKSPVAPDDGGDIRLSKVFINNYLLNTYEYDGAGRLLKRYWSPGSISEGKTDFVYDEYGRIKQFREERIDVDVYYVTDVSYHPNDDIKQKVKSTIRKVSGEKFSETQTDFSYLTVDVGRKITAVTTIRFPPVYASDTTGIEIYYVYWNSAAGRLYGNLYARHSIDNNGDTVSTIYYRYSTSDDPLKPDVSSSNPYIYASTYGYDNVKTSPNVPVSEHYYGRRSSGSVRPQTVYQHLYSTNPQNNLIEVDRTRYFIYERPDSTIYRYEYTRIQ